MSKYNFTQEIKEAYKNKEREIKVKADIDLGGQRQGVNFLPPLTFNRHNTGMTDLDLTIDIKNWDCSINGYFATSYSDMLSWTFDSSLTIPAGTYTLTMIREESKGNQSSNSYFSISIPYKKTQGQTGYSLFSLSSGLGPSTEKTYISKTITFDFDQVITGTGNNKISIDINKSGSVNQVYNESFKLILNEGTEPCDWWEEGSSGGLVDNVFTFGEDGICEIIDFNITEKSDIYYEQMPYSEISFYVDNSKGYFNDFSTNSIVNSLTKDVVLNLYLKINNTDWLNAWTMQFESLSADNDRATLIFKPRCIRTFNSELYDKDKLFSSYTTLTYTRLQQYLSANYNVNIYYDNNEGFVSINEPHILNKVSDLFVSYAGDLAVGGKPQILCISNNNSLRYKIIQYSSSVDNPHANENITSNELLEKPLITKEELQGVIINYHFITGVLQRTSNFQKSIKSTFKNTNETLIVFCDNLNANDISQNNITLTNAILVSLGYSMSNIASRYLVIEISGVVGEEYTIDINGTLRDIELSDNQGIFTKQQYEDTDDFITIDGVNNGLYWTNLKDNMAKKIKLKIKALPYLQVGDCITFEEEGKETTIADKVVITEINTSWSGGFKMEITAYKVYDE